jgi:hypothetical protein
MLTEGKGDDCGDAFHPEVVVGAGVVAFVLEGAHEVFNLWRAGCDGLNDP